VGEAKKRKKIGGGGAEKKKKKRGGTRGLLGKDKKDVKTRLTLAR